MKRLLNVIGYLLMASVAVFLIYRTGYGYGYAEGSRQNEHDYNGVDTGDTIEQLVQTYRSAEGNDKTNTLRGCHRLLRTYVSRYQKILGTRDTGDSFRETWNEALRISKDKRFETD